MPHFIDTRWNTLYYCSSFIIKNKSIDELIKEYIASEQMRFNTEHELFNDKKKKYPPKPNEFPGELATYIEPLKVIAGFTNCIEGDLCLLDLINFLLINNKEINAYEFQNTNDYFKFDEKDNEFYGIL